MAKEEPVRQVIESPKLGILNLKGDSSAGVMAEDKEALIPVFDSVLESQREVPHCDVLLIYCDLQANGRIHNSSEGLREIIRDSGASVVVVASENEGEGYIAAAQHKDYGLANLVMTVERNGKCFPRFFHDLFAQMKRGVTMPVAWVTLAPQIPGRVQEDCPVTIFACELGQVAFN